MWNVLLDPLPKEWNGFPIDFDFQTGIQISQCLCDESLSEIERFYTAVLLLFPEKVPDDEEAAKAIRWYLNAFHHDNNIADKSDIQVMDFDVDQWRIYAAFINQYGIDLNTVKMHWFTFMGLLCNLNECTFTNVMDIRQKKITGKMSKEEKERIKRMQMIFSIKNPVAKTLSREESQRISDFMKYINVSKE